jgi:hypothetical protein
MSQRAILSPYIFAPSRVAGDEVLEPRPQGVERLEDLCRAGAVFLACDPDGSVGEPVAGPPLSASASGHEHEQQSGTTRVAHPDDRPTNSPES